MGRWAQVGHGLMPPVQLCRTGGRRAEPNRLARIMLGPSQVHVAGLLDV